MNQIKLPPLKRPAQEALGMSVIAPRQIVCPGCHASLTITSSQEIVSGPCPSCGTHIDSQIHAVSEPAESLASQPLPPPELIRQIVDAIMDAWRRTSQPASAPLLETSNTIPKPSRMRPDVPTGFKFLHEVGHAQNPDTAFDAPDAPRKKSRFEGKIMMAFAAMGILALGMGGTWIFLNRSGKMNATLTRVAALPDAPHIVDAPGLPPTTSVDSLKNSIESFSAATTTAERLKWILAPSRVKESMEAYYKSHPDISETTRLARYDVNVIPVGGKDLAYGVAAMVATPKDQGSPPKVLLFKRENSDEASPYLLDWETYVQEMDNDLQQFVKNHDREPTVFRLKLQRKHLFDDGVTDDDLGIALQTLSGEPMPENLLIHPGDAYYERLSQQLKWGETPLATVKLAWHPAETKGDKSSKASLALDEFICWEARGVGRQAEDGKGDSGVVAN